MRSLRDLVPRPAPPVNVVPGRVAVVIPAFNESGKIGAVVRKVPRRSAGFEFAVILSGDQHEPDELPRVLEPLFAGEADLVQGSRWLPGGATPGIPADRQWLTRLYPLLFRWASGYPSTDGTNGFRAFRLAMLADPRIRLEQAWLDRYELEPYLLFQAVRCG